jgi:hypothetical protein
MTVLRAFRRIPTKVEAVGKISQHAGLLRWGTASRNTNATPKLEDRHLFAVHDFLLNTLNTSTISGGNLQHEWSCGKHQN